MGRSQIIFCLFLAACSGADFKSLSKSDLNSSEPTVDSQQEDEFTQAQEPTSITGTNLTDSYVQAFRAPPTSPEADVKSSQSLYREMINQYSISRLSPIASRLSPIASRLSPIASRLSPIASRLSPIAQRDIANRSIMDEIMDEITDDM